MYAEQKLSLPEPQPQTSTTVTVVVSVVPEDEVQWALLHQELEGPHSQATGMALACDIIESHAFLAVKGL